jgi:hypothetical protein
LHKRHILLFLRSFKICDRPAIAILPWIFLSFEWPAAPFVNPVCLPMSDQNSGNCPPIDRGQ